MRCAGTIRRYLLSARLLFDVIKKNDPEDRSRVRSSRRTTASGAKYHFYHSEKQCRKPFVMIYGLTMKGENDPRLVRFSRSFAKAGFHAAVPDLPGLKSFRFDDGDTRIIEDLIGALHSQYGKSVGVAAFSFGAGLALHLAVKTAESKPSRPVIDPLFLFGPVYSVPDLSARIGDLMSRLPSDDEEWDHHIWIKLILLYRNLHETGLDESQKRRLGELLYDYCELSPSERKKAFLENRFDRETAIDCKDFLEDLDSFAKSMPVGSLHKIPSRVLLIHDETDGLVPPVHSERIYEELTKRGIPDGQRLLVTPLLSHVTGRSAWKPLDVFCIIRIFDEIFR